MNRDERRQAARAAALAVAIGGLLGAMLLPVPASATPSSAPVPGSASARVSDDAPTIGEHTPAQFAAAAGQLPPALVEAVRTDLGQSAEQYLADAATADDAAEVVSHLERRGVDVTGSRVDGSRVTIGVSSAADLAAVQATGATAVVGDVTAPVDVPRLHPAADLLGGTAWGYLTNATTGAGVRCSVGFNGNGPGGAAQYVTAGHCKIGTPQSAINQIVQTAPGQSGPFGATIGSMVEGSFQYGGGVDSGRIAVTGSGVAPVPGVSTWAGGTGSPSAAPLTVRGDTTGVVGAAVCKSGSTTGWTCGHILAVDQLVDVDDQEVNAILTDACVLEGDSGGAAVVGSYALGVTSASSYTTACGSDPISAFFPLRSSSGAPSVATAQSGWQLQVGLATPVPDLASGGSTFAAAPFTGTVAGANGETRVDVYFDGRTDAQGASASATLSSSGRWSVALPSATGTHSYRIVARWGSQSSAEATGTVVVTANPAVDRISGSDRFETAVKVSQAGFPGTAGTVFVASGVGFADALSAGPAAVEADAPLLLTTPGAVPAVVLTELKRLSPTRIVLVGGTAAVSADAEAQLATVAPVRRISGSDRFETSRAVAGYAFGGGASRAFLATGVAFADALSAGAAAGANHAPVVLVRGSDSAADQATVAFLRTLGVGALDVVGGPASITQAYADSLTTVAPVTREGGSDRFETAIAVNAAGFASARAAFVASGLAFPDALSGSALAGLRGAPLYVVPPSCLPVGVTSELSRYGVSTMTIVGGPAVVAPAVAAFTPCG
ncbi:cell wall-binding repeat-containing protein [Leifsonia sp. ZF2019]|uniref:cell wall-binding repeat-containing protein n=1 Tax=Leifsonia sp. ZF2019 TaxID=2781978 RepID=UPI001CBD0776|nr:cell wall-binding repeat-containing protein [Leifsonia sp. ZF2019]UAJ80551.1 cell wall-binding repeat-containing protein [Leifsonia sp. ZF2019]